MKKIAKNEYEIAEVIANLTNHEKIERVSKLYNVDEILEILGFFDGTMDKEGTIKIEETEDNSEERDFAAYLLAIDNGNFEVAIAMNLYLPI